VRSQVRDGERVTDGKELIVEHMSRSQRKLLQDIGRRLVNGPAGRLLLDRLAALRAPETAALATVRFEQGSCPKDHPDGEATLDAAGLLLVRGRQANPGAWERGLRVRVAGRQLEPAWVAAEGAVAHAGGRLCAAFVLGNVQPGQVAEVVLDSEVILSAAVSERVRPAYDHFLTTNSVLHRHDVYGSGPPIDAVEPELLSLAAKLPTPILDVGCGTGALVAALRDHGKDVRGLELDSKRGAIPATRADCVSFYDGKMPLPFADRSFASVTCVEVLEHVADYEAFAAELARVTEESLLLSVPDISAIPVCSRIGMVPWHLLELTHVNFFTPRSLRHLLRRWFQSVELVRFGAATVNGVEFFGNVCAIARKRR
jgi:SAM-dependent methyltransferase